MISIIVPVYNVEKYLEKCVSSILNQSFTDFELIIINDGSTDKSLNICKEFEQRDERITLINQQNGGLSEARNSGIKIATRPYITFVDSDDWIKETYLEDLYTLITENNADISICEYVIDIEKSNSENKLKYRNNNLKITKYSKNEALSVLFIDKEINNHAWGKLYKTTFFNDISYPKNKYFEDVFTTYKLFNKADVIVKINKVLIHYLQRDGNITSISTNSEKKDIDFYESFLEQLNFVRNNEGDIPNLLHVKSALSKQFYRFKKRVLSTYTFKSKLFIDKEKEVDKEMKALLNEISILKMGLLFYFKYRLILNQPKIFLKYLKLTRK